MTAPNPCKCGKVPNFLSCHDGPRTLIQLACKCGHRTACIHYDRPDQKPQAEQALIDGWNIG
jgi:hypothetical protein